MFLSLFVQFSITPIPQRSIFMAVDNVMQQRRIAIPDDRPIAGNTGGVKK